ncbi:MAG: ATP-binding cassette domain-containing protein [Spirochaetaceae bacterium]|jgi:peptide/nickel transport system ATP-binding protein|nr:ATP-binding cassette domain-containing protein [Spirochaetaceae bacterium]
MPLEAKNISFKYKTASGFPPGASAPERWILKDAGLTLREGCRTALLGPSGCGKSTLAKILSLWEKPFSGGVFLDGLPFRLDAVKGPRPVQLILQHPEKAVNPRFKMKDVLEEAGVGVSEALEKFGVEKSLLNRFPRELSGGELQRFCIARALCRNTRFIIADEITAMFDPITQAQLWRALLNEAQARNIGVLVITHEEALARRICKDFLRMEETAIKPLQDFQ